MEIMGSEGKYDPKIHPETKKKKKSNPDTFYEFFMFSTSKVRNFIWLYQTENYSSSRSFLRLIEFDLTHFFPEII